MSIFSLEERRALVRSFIEAYQRGSVTIQFGIEPEKAHQGKTMFEQHVAKVSGAFETTKLPDQIDLGFDYSIDFLFRYIFSLRLGERIVGEFTETPTILTQLADLNAAATKTTIALDAIKDWMTRYEPILKEAEKDYRDKLDRIQPT